MWNWLNQDTQVGAHLGIVNGVQLLDLVPLLRHQEAIDRIRTSIELSNPDPACTCYHVTGAGIQFPDNSLRIPDISIFSKRPVEENGLVVDVPSAVIEVISPGYEAKDLEFGPPFYMSRGVRDVIVFDPHTLRLVHLHHGRVEQLVSPAAIQLECGCRCVI